MAQRKLAAIMFTDIVGYTALMGSDEDRAFEVLRKNRNIHKGLIKKHRGKLIKEMGNGTLISFQLASDTYAIMDENEKALRYISEFDNWSWLDYIQIDPIFENLHDDPEFKAIVKRAKEQKAALRAQLKDMEERGEITL